MPGDRLKDDSDPVFDPDDLIEVREERTSASANDVDALEDIESVDVDEALTFPHHHPHREEKAPEVETLDAPSEEDIGSDYQDNAAEMLPSDYAEPYSDALSTHLADDEEAVVNEELERISLITPGEFVEDTQLTDMPEEGGPPEIEEEG